MRLSRDPAARRRLAALCLAAGVSGIAGVLAGSGAGGGGQVHPGPAATAPGGGAAQSPDTARASRLSLERQIGQLLVLSFDGTQAPGYVRRILRQGLGSGVIVFGKNAPDAGSLRSLTATLQRAAGGGALVATDQEGGPIRSVAFAPPESSQGALGSPAAARSAAAGAAGALRDLGVNVNLAPVADVAAAGAALAGRTYPGDAAAVARLTTEAVEALGRERVAATVKHFPGFGRARQNTDDAPVTIPARRSELERSDLLPFRAASDARVPLVMVSHALYPAFDRQRIASQSRTLIQGTLRRRLGFRGAVITDSIEADAVLARSGVAVAAERSIEAGADLVLMTGSGSWKQVHPYLLRRARASRSLRARVREAAARVIALKRRLGLQVRPR